MNRDSIKRTLLEIKSPERRAELMRNDEAVALHAAREMEYVYAKTYDKVFPELAMGSGAILPVDSTIPSGSLTFVYYSFEETGFAKILNAYAAKDLPRVGLARTQNVGTIRDVGNAWGYNIKDLRAASLVQTPFSLDRSYANASKRGHVQVWNDIGLFGSTKHNLPGLLNHPNITYTAAPDNGSGDVFWTDKTPAQVIADFEVLINTPRNLSNKVHIVNTVLVPDNMMSFLMGTPIGLTNDSNLSIWDYLKNSWPNVDFGSLLELRSSLSSGNLAQDMAIAYEKSEDTASLVIPQGFEQFDGVWDGLEYVVSTHSEVGGVKMPRPFAFSAMTGIDQT